MSYEIYIVNKDTFERIEKIQHIENINWTDDIDNVFISFTFSCTKAYLVGNWIELYEKDDKKTIFYGIITRQPRNRAEIYTYSGFDKGFYLEKNKITIQYRNSNISNAIKEACKEINVECGTIPKIDYTVKKIYKNNTVTDVLKDLLKIAKEKGLKGNLYFDCKNGKLNLYEYALNDSLKGYVANIYRLNTFDTVNSFDITYSIENMKNKIKVISSVTKNKQTTINERYTTPENENTKKYGILQEIIELDADEKQSSETIAKKTLSELNIVEQEISLDVIGDYNVRKGTITPIKKERLNIDDYFLIKSSNHNIVGTKETVSINVIKANL